VKAPYSSGKDWSKIEKNLAKVSVGFFYSPVRMAESVTVLNFFFSLNVVSTGSGGEG
jgi:hypothetical protein